MFKIKFWVKKLFNKLFIIICSFILFSCTSSSNLSIEKTDFSSITSLEGDYGNLFIEKKFPNKLEKPYIDYYVPEKLSDIIIKWAQKRFGRQDENSKVIRVKILKANTSAFALKTDKNIENILNDSPIIRIEMNIEVYIELINEKGIQLAYTEVKAFKSKELGENISLNERDYQIHEMSKSIFYDFDRIAIAKIQEVFKDYLY